MELQAVTETIPFPRLPQGKEKILFVFLYAVCSSNLIIALTFVLRGLGLFQGVLGFAGSALLRTGLDLLNAGIKRMTR